VAKPKKIVNGVTEFTRPIKGVSEAHGGWLRIQEHTKARPPAMTAPKRPPETAFWKAAEFSGGPEGVGVEVGAVPLVLWRC
jgi:hypothetical protein